jgi:hypothetical protein
MCMKPKLPESKRKRQDRSVRRAEKKLVQHGTSRSYPGQLRTHPTVQMNAARRLRHETLDRQAKSCHPAVERPSTWGMSVR